MKWWPARVTRPVPRIKSPLHHFNACRPKLVLAAGLAPALTTLSTSCLCIGLHELLAQCHKDGASRRCCPGRISLQRKSAGCCEEAKWSQSPVLPWTPRAYETCLSAGSTAVVADGQQKWSPHPELHRADSLTERMHR